MTNQKVYIYTLSNPIDNTVVYVGKSINPRVRYNTYIKQAKGNKRKNLIINWVKSLLKNGLKPKMEIIDEIVGEWEWLEQYWVAQFKAWGFNLKNMTIGGDSNPMDNPEIRKKISIHMKNINRGEIWRVNISNAKKGVKIHTLESKKRLSKLNSGVNNPMYNKKHTNDALKKMKLTVIQKSLSGEFIKEWSSAADVERETNMLARSINRCAKGDRKTAYGFKWDYKKDKD